MRTLIILFYGWLHMFSLNYSNEDIIHVQNLIVQNEQPTYMDYVLYDCDNSQSFSSIDVVEIQRQMNRLDYVYIKTYQNFILKVIIRPNEMFVYMYQ